MDRVSGGCGVDSLVVVGPAEIGVVFRERDRRLSSGRDCLDFGLEGRDGAMLGEVAPVGLVIEWCGEGEKRRKRVKNGGGLCPVSTTPFDAWKCRARTRDVGCGDSRELVLVA